MRNTQDKYMEYTEQWKTRTRTHLQALSKADNEPKSVLGGKLFHTFKIICVTEYQVELEASQF